MSDLLTVRYPSGDFEFRMSEKAPEVGDVLHRNGDDWIVEEVSASEDGTAVITVRPGPKPVEPDDTDASAVLGVAQSPPAETELVPTLPQRPTSPGLNSISAQPGWPGPHGDAPPLFST